MNMVFLNVIASKINLNYQQDEPLHFSVQKWDNFCKACLYRICFIVLFAGIGLCLSFSKHGELKY